MFHSNHCMNWKVFRCSSFSKMLPRCGRAAHICEANLFLRFGFPAAIVFLKPSNSNKVKWRESRLQIQTRQRGDCSMLVGKSRGETPFCRTGKTVFSKKNKLFVYDSTSWECAPALPNRTRWVYLRIMVLNDEPQAKWKFFGAAVFQKCCWGVGEQPTFAKQICFWDLAFLLQSHFWNHPIQIKLNDENQGYKFRQGNGAIAACW